MPIESRHYVSPGQQSLNELIARGFSSGAEGVNQRLQQLLQGKQKEDELNQQAKLVEAAKDSSAARDIKGLQAIQANSPNAQAKFGQAEQNVDPEIAQALKTQNISGAQSRQAQLDFNKTVKPHLDQLKNYQNGLEGLQAGDIAGTTQAVIAAARANANNLRGMGSTIKAFGGDPSAAETPEKLENWLTGHQNEVKSPAFMASIHGLLSRGAKQATDAMNNDIKAFGETAGFNYPQAAMNPDFSQHLNAVQKPILAQSQKVQSLVDKGNEIWHPAAIGGQAPVNQAPPGLLQKVGSGLAGLFGGRKTPDLIPSAAAATPQQAPQAAPLANPQPVPPQGFDPNAFLGGP